jgi:hypothetical protein
MESKRGIQIRKIREYLDQIERLDRIPNDPKFDDRFYFASKACSELDELMWYILEDMKMYGGRVTEGDLREAEQMKLPEIKRVDMLLMGHYPPIEKVIGYGTKKAKLNSLLRIAVTGRKD